MKKIINYLSNRKSVKLRKWCVEKTLKAHVPGGEFLATIEWLYKWVSKGSN